MIHQIFIPFSDGKTLADFPIYQEQVQKTMAYCVKNTISYKLWSLRDCEELVQGYPEYSELYHNLFRYDIQRVDFMKYLILYDRGGVYLDCDVCPIDGVDISHLYEMPSFVSRWTDSPLPYNACCGFHQHNPLLLHILAEIDRSTKEKNAMPIYERWKGRYVFHTTGHHMLKRALKHHSCEILDILRIVIGKHGYSRKKKGQMIVSAESPLFEDVNANGWMERKGGEYCVR